MLRTTGIISAISCGLRPASTSSSSSRRGRVASARASSRRLRPATVRSEAGLSSCGAQAHAHCATCFGLRPAPRARPRTCRCAPTGDVLAHGLRREGLHDLEGAGHAERAALRCGSRPVMSSPREAHGAGVGLEETRHQREQRGLARAVRADQRAQAALAHREAHVLHGLQAAEGAREAIDGQQRLQSLRPPFAFHSCRTDSPMPAMPRGTKMTMSTSTVP